MSKDFDTCKAVTVAEVCRLRSEGIDARWIQVAGLTAEAPGADERWDGVDPAFRNHYVIKVGSEYHDLTPRQFWPDAPVPLIEGDYMHRWAREYDVTEAAHDYNREVHT